MLKKGICSISHRDKSVTEVIAIAVEAGLDGIEWGGDVHVPHGDIVLAQKVKEETLKASLLSPSYGSYYKVGESEDNGLLFTDVLASCKALGANVIRVWAGGKNWEDADDLYIKKIVSESIRISQEASKYDINIAFEFHGNTLTNTNESTIKFQEMLKSANPTCGIKFYWQPPVGKSFEYCKEGLIAILPNIAHIHAFHWSMDEKGGIVRNLLADGKDNWAEYVKILKNNNKDCWIHLEFSLDNKAENTIADGKTLAQLLEK